MKQSKGFTLIELVAVIAILAITAAIAAPKFLSISREARIATLESYVAAFKNADDIVMAKAKIHNLEGSYEQAQIPGTDIFVQQGHMQLQADNVRRAMDVDGIHLSNHLAQHAIFAYHSTKELPVMELKNNPCYVQIGRSFSGSSNPEHSATHQLGELKVYRFYDHC